MSVLRRTLYAAPAALGLLAAAVSPAMALPAERTLFTWSGRVDREVVLVIRGRSVETRGSGVDASFAPRLDVRDDLPRQTGDVQGRLSGGRGEVDVLQQPSARNDYTAMVRVRDPRAGSDDYRMVVSWQSVGYSTDGRGDVRGGDRGDYGNRDRDRDGVGDRDIDRDADRDRDRVRDDKKNRGRGNDEWDDRGGNGRGSNNPGGNRRGGNNRGGNGRDAGRVAWRGAVDDVVDIRIQGRRVEYRTRSGQPLRNVRYDLGGNGLPRRPVTIDLDVSRGRGDVIVVQQPNARNGYTAIVRVIDRRSGYGDYDFDLRWY